jgi:hypothetical protein
MIYILPVTIKKSIKGVYNKTMLEQRSPALPYNIRLPPAAHMAVLNLILLG